ncbi:uncharacterized protein ACA1_211380, partial [Acanthamoeba castellanii str. Neff]
MWSFNNVHKGFEDHAYMNDLDGMINDFYHWLFVHQIDFAFDLDKEHKQMKEEMQRKIACDKYEASSMLMTLALSAQDQYSSEYEMHVEEEKEEKEEGEAVTKAASLLMEAHGLDAEMILACAMHVLGGYEGLVLFGDGLNTKALAFTIDNGPKELICWRFNECIDHLIAFKLSGQILYMSCVVGTGDMELFCPTCYFKMTNALFFSGHNLLSLLFGANKKLATEQQLLKQKCQASNKGDKGDNNKRDRVFSYSKEEKVNRSESKVKSEVKVESESEETINDVEDTQGDELEDEDDEQMEDEAIMAMAAINTKRANNNNDAHIPEDPMGPATEEELNEHNLPPGAIEHTIADLKNKALYKHMQHNNATKRTMEDLLHMHQNPPFCFRMIAESIHVLSKAGQ